MDTKRLLFFIELLNRETDGHSAEIIRLFQRALDENDEIKELKSFLNTEEYYYYHEIGKNLYKSGKKVLNDIYQKPSDCIALFPQIGRAISSISYELDTSYRLIASPFPFKDNINVLKKRDVEAIRIAYERIANSCIFLLALYEGIQPIQNFTWNDQASISEMLEMVNTIFLPSLFQISSTTRSWIITRHELGGNALFGGDGFFLTYNYQQEIQEKCRYIYGKRMGGTYSFCNVDAFINKKNDVPYCWGTGNILSVYPYNATTFLQPGKKITIKLRCPRNDELMEDNPFPFECVKRLADSDMFCITPEELVLAMNRWEMGHEIAMRKHNHQCLFCGKKINSYQLVCKSHFQG